MNESKLLKDAFETQTRLFHFSLQGSLRKEALPALSALIEVPFALFNLSGELLFNNTGIDDDALALGWPWNDRPRLVKVEGRRLVRHTLGLKGNRHGNVLFAHEAQMSTVKHTLLSCAADLMARMLDATPNFDRRIAEVSLDMVLGEHLVGEASLETVIEQAVLERKELPTAGYCALLLCNPADRRDLSIREECQRFIDGLSDFLHCTVDTILVASMERGQLLILPLATGTSMKTVKSAAIQSLTRLMRPGAEDTVWKVLLSRPKSELAALRDAYQETVDTQRITAGLGIKDLVAAFQDIEFATLFEGMQREQMLRYNREVFKSLHASTHARDRRLMITLEAFMEHETQIPDTARDLGVHKNTIAYRLDQAAEIMGIDLRKTSDLLRVKLAFILRRILQRTEINTALREDQPGMLAPVQAPASTVIVRR